MGNILTNCVNNENRIKIEKQLYCKYCKKPLRNCIMHRKKTYYKKCKICEK